MADVEYQYVGIVFASSDEAEQAARELRQKDLNANQQQGHFVIVGPLSWPNDLFRMDEKMLLTHKYYQNERYEDCLSSMYEGEGHKVPDFSERPRRIGDGRQHAYINEREWEAIQARGGPAWKKQKWANMESDKESELEKLTEATEPRKDS